MVVFPSHVFNLTITKLNGSRSVISMILAVKSLTSKVSYILDAPICDEGDEFLVSVSVACMWHENVSLSVSVTCLHFQIFMHVCVCSVSADKAQTTMSVSQIVCVCLTLFINVWTPQSFLVKNILFVWLYWNTKIQPLGSYAWASLWRRWILYLQL